MQELLAREAEMARQQALLRQEALRAADAQQAALRSRAAADYAARIQAKVKGNIVLPPGTQGDPSALFQVDQLPDGTVIAVRLERSSGSPALDSAIERAIHRSSPLPKPTDSSLFRRTLDLTFWPLRN